MEAHRFRNPLIAIVLVGLAATVAAAQSMRHFREGQTVDLAEVASILGHGGPAPRTRSTRLLPGEGPAHADGGDGPVSLLLPLQLAFDCATIPSAARPQLGALAAGIQRLPAERSVLIEGHTDASCALEYKLQRSWRRAAAVKADRVQAGGVDPRRLRTVGAGEDRLIDGSEPSAGRNRRV
jgi:outer membrane protein OmpA-like peptidoglycan-associated protein